VSHGRPLLGAWTCASVGDTMLIRGHAQPLDTVPSMTLYRRLGQSRIPPAQRAAIGRELARRTAGGVVRPWPIGRRRVSRVVAPRPGPDARWWRELRAAPPRTLATVFTPCGARGRALLRPIAFGFWQIRVHWDTRGCGEACTGGAVESAHVAIAHAAARQLEVPIHRLADVVINPSARQYREPAR
jgi:hypothetical protein